MDLGQLRNESRSLLEQLKQINNDYGVAKNNHQQEKKTETNSKPPQPKQRQKKPAHPQANIKAQQKITERANSSKRNNTNREFSKGSMNNNEGAIKISTDNPTKNTEKSNINEETQARKITKLPITTQDDNARLQELNSTGNARPDLELDSNRTKLTEYPKERLGYDWIAGIMDTSSFLSEKSDEYFNEIREFRRLHRKKCVKETPLDKAQIETILGKNYERVEHRAENIADNMGTCVRTYNVDSRGFCREQYKADENSTADNPNSYIRVSVPRSSLEMPYRLKPKDMSYNPIASLSIKQHCQTGWTGSNPSISNNYRAKERQQNADLKSHIDPDVPALGGKLKLKSLSQPTLTLMMQDNDAAIVGTGETHTRTRKLINNTYGLIYDQYRHNYTPELD